MNKKFLSFMPGDDVDINIHLKCNKFTVLKIEAIEIDNSDSKSDFLKIEL